jgi:hypothetical protein
MKPCWYVSNKVKARNALWEVHEEICSTHVSGDIMTKKIHRAGYF